MTRAESYLLLQEELPGLGSKGSDEAALLEGGPPVLHGAEQGTLLPLSQGAEPVSPEKSCQSGLSRDLGIQREQKEQRKEGPEFLVLLPSLWPEGSSVP